MPLFDKLKQYYTGYQDTLQEGEDNLNNLTANVLQKGIPDLSPEQAQAKAQAISNMAQSGASMIGSIAPVAQEAAPLVKAALKEGAPLVKTALEDGVNFYKGVPAKLKALLSKEGSSTLKELAKTSDRQPLAGRTLDIAREGITAESADLLGKLGARLRYK